MSKTGTEALGELLEAFREKAQGDEPVLWERALTELETLERARPAGS
jgi:hypothetical protein